MLDRCRRGHLLNKMNTGLRVKADGKTSRWCRKCLSERRRFKYKTDPVIREKHKARELKRYYDNKEFSL